MSKDQSVLVCGGAVVDCIVKPFDQRQRGASRTSLPGVARTALGGVGRNIAEVIARLGGKVEFLSAVGKDEPGHAVLHGCHELGIQTDLVTSIVNCRTATYTALLDGTGELVGAIADMAVFDEISDTCVESAAPAFDRSGLVICDANLPTATLERLARLGAEARVPVWFEPVSVAKAVKGARPPHPWHLISPNWDELLAVLGRPPEVLPDGGMEIPLQVFRTLVAARDAGLAEYILLTLGPLGALLAVPQLPTSPNTMNCTQIFDMPNALHSLACYIPPMELRIDALNVDGAPALWFHRQSALTSVKDVTGAGDALLAGTARAFANGWSLPEAVAMGMFCAHVTIFVEGAVAQCLNGDAFMQVTASLRPGLVSPRSKL